MGNKHKKHKNEYTQSQLLKMEINFPILYEDADMCRKLLVAYLHDQTAGMDVDAKYDYAKKHIFPLCKKIDLFLELDKLKNPILVATYFRIRKNFTQTASDCFCLISLVEILLIIRRFYITCTDDEILEMALNFCFKTNITKDLIQEELFNIREAIKKQKTD